MSCFVNCPDCSRHVRNDEPTCPFCNGNLVGARCQALSNPTSGALVHRAFMFAAAAASIGSACSIVSSSSPEPLYGPAGWGPDASTGAGGTTEGSGGTAGSAGTSAAGTGGVGGAPSDAGSEGSAAEDAGDAGTPSDASGE